MPAAWVEGGVALLGAYSASQSGGGGGGGDAGAAIWQAQQDAALAQQQNAFNNPDRYSNLGSETRTKIHHFPQIIMMDLSLNVIYL